MKSGFGTSAIQSLLINRRRLAEKKRTDKLLAYDLEEQPLNPEIVGIALLDI